MSELDAFRDDRLEQLVLGHLMQHPTTAPAYDAAGCEVRLFANPVRRQLWSLISECLEEGIAPIWPNLETRAKARGLEEVSAAYLLQFDREPLPRLEASALEQHVERLRVLADAREEYIGLKDDGKALRDDPAALPAILERRAQLRQQRADRDAFYPELDDDSLGQLPELADLIEHLVPALSLVVLFGPPGAGKTFIALVLAWSLVTGRPVFGFKMRGEPRDVVYIAGEGHAKLRQRVAALKQHTHSTGRRLGIRFVLRAVDLTDTTAVGRFIGQYHRVKPAAVFVDTLARCMVGDENSTEVMSAFVRGCDRIRDALGCSVVVLHHTNATGNRERGNSALRGAADVMVEMRQDDGVVTVASSKQKDSPPFATFELALKDVGASAVLVAADRVVLDREDAPITPGEERLLEVLRRSFATTGATDTQWLAVAIEAGITRATYYRAKASLERKHLALKVGSRFFPGAQRKGEAA